MSIKRDFVSNQLIDQSKTSELIAATASNGAPIDTITASLTSGPTGDILLKDFTLIDHIAAFDRERIPERVVHAKGAGAFGFFEVTSNELSKYSKAKLFDSIGKQTKVAVRFSTVGGESGSADTVRDPRGFAVKFYTEEGNWDLVGNNTPIFFIRDPILFPSFIHTQKRNPATHTKDADMMWDFISLRPETTHQVSFLFSDRGIPDGYRFMNGYGSHTFKVVNNDGEAFYVKWHFKTDQGISNLPVDVADKIAGSDPDYSIRDLYNAIAAGNYPSWTLYVQIMSFAEAESLSFNPFDVTKVWSHKDYPLIEVGRLVLNQNPSNYFAEIEQIAFAPAHLVPGIEPSPDKMLQGRLFSYADTHRHRLGVNYQSIPVNCPFATRVSTYQRDGNMAVDGNMGGTPNYFPNSFQGPQPSNNLAWHTYSTVSDVKRYETGDEDNFSQVREFYLNVLSDSERDRLTTNIANSLSAAQEFIQQRAIANFTTVDSSYGETIAKKINQIKSKHNQSLSSKSIAPLNPPRNVPNYTSKI